MFALLVMLGAASGCGNTNSNSGRTNAGGTSSAGAPAQGGSAGSAGSSAGATSGGASSGGSAGTAGSASGGSAGTSSGPPETDSLRYACQKYLLAVCYRIEECTGASVACTFSSYCPDYLFSPGSVRTRESVLACADEYRTQPCEEVIAGISPACAVPGTRAEGEPCFAGSQCASGACTGSNSCGQCVPMAEPGGACDDFTACPLRQTCDGVTCMDSPLALSPDRLPGAVCSIGCIRGYMCDRATATSEPTCLPYPALGAPCYYENFPDGDANPGRCGAGQYCNSDFTCAPLPGEGEPCIPSDPPLCSGYDVCEGGVCRSQTNAGTSCTSFVDCTGGTQCLCESGYFDCPTGTCVFLREEGEACGTSGTLCAAGTECVSSVCTATDELSRWALCAD